MRKQSDAGQVGGQLRSGGGGVMSAKRMVNGPEGGGGK